ncbi:MAG: hypothetical protein JNL28_15145 [Planctomycetes bacterium]|nr:hypothetical protein [Planctomycetota bacterium]
MKNECLAFRTLLEQKLVGRPDPSSLSALSWHEHLLGCADCRRFLEGEEALEALLATLPEPRLAPDVKRRVLVALARARQTVTSLDALLERDVEAVAPKDLARRVLVGLERERASVAAHADQQLDLLLMRAGQVETPRDLSRRVLLGLARERRPVARPILAFRRSAWMAAAAAVLVITLVVWAVKRVDAPLPKPEIVQELRAPDKGMLAALDVLENWELLMRSDDVDVLLASLGAVEETLLDYQDEG